MSQTQTEQSQTTAAAPPPDDDPLSHLHKMSTTAGLGSGDYVEVNGAAVAALLLGLGSALALLESLLLILPLAGIIVAIIAFRQIHHSNGTQTGRGLAALGVVLMLGFGGYVLAQNVTAEMRTRDDRRAISEVVSQMGEKVKAADYDGAYTFYSSRFQQGVPLDKFKGQIKYLNEAAVYGKLKKVDTGLMQFQVDESTGARYATTRVLLEFEKTERPLAEEFIMKKEGDQWRIEAFQTMFGKPGAQGGQPGG